MSYYQAQPDPKQQYYQQPYYAQQPPNPYYAPEGPVETKPSYQPPPPSNSDGVKFNPKPKYNV